MVRYHKSDPKEGLDKEKEGRGTEAAGKDPKEPWHLSSLKDQWLRITKELILIFFWESARYVVELG